MSENTKKVPLLLWPFVAIWNLIAWIVNLTGRMLAVILGLLFLILGVILIVLVITIPLGIPLALFGLLLMVRGLW
jgi:hypothetical protein